MKRGWDIIFQQSFLRVTNIFLPIRCWTEFSIEVCKYILLVLEYKFMLLLIFQIEIEFANLYLSNFASIETKLHDIVIPNFYITLLIENAIYLINSVYSLIILKIQQLIYICYLIIYDLFINFWCLSFFGLISFEGLQSTLFIYQYWLMLSFLKPMRFCFVVLYF